jgi:hypothetical protein
MADPTLAGLVNVLGASRSGVSGGQPNSSTPVSVQQLVGALGGWPANQQGVPVKQYGLAAAWMNPFGSSVPTPGPQPYWTPGGSSNTPIPETRPPGYNNPVVPPPYIGGGGETRIPNPEAPPQTPVTPQTPVAPVFPMPGESVTGNTTASQSTGQHVYTNNGTEFGHTVVPIEESALNYYIPPQYVGRPLPGGAYKTLFPNSAGTGWSKIKPEGWGPNWRPTNVPTASSGTTSGTVQEPVLQPTPVPHPPEAPPTAPVAPTAPVIPPTTNPYVPPETTNPEVPPPQTPPPVTPPPVNPTPSGKSLTDVMLWAMEKGAANPTTLAAVLYNRPESEWPMILAQYQPTVDPQGGA